MGITQVLPTAGKKNPADISRDVWNFTWPFKTLCIYSTIPRETLIWKQWTVSLKNRLWITKDWQMQSKNRRALDKRNFNKTENASCAWRLAFRNMRRRMACDEDWLQSDELRWRQSGCSNGHIKRQVQSTRWHTLTEVYPCFFPRL
jgi:hypothetical protein